MYNHKLSFFPCVISMKETIVIGLPFPSFEMISKALTQIGPQLNAPIWRNLN